MQDYEAPRIYIVEDMLQGKETIERLELLLTKIKSDNIEHEST